MDYPGVALPDEVLTQLGWTRAEQEMVHNWYFMDTNISAKAFETIAAYRKAQMSTDLGTKLTSGLQTVRTFFAQEAGYPQRVAIAGRDRALQCWLTVAQAWDTLPLAYVGRGGCIDTCVTALPWHGGAFAFASRADGYFAHIRHLVWVIACLRAANAHPSVAGQAAGGRLGLWTIGAYLWYAIPAAQALAPVATDDADEAGDRCICRFGRVRLGESRSAIYLRFHLYLRYAHVPSTELGIPTNVMFWGGWGARSPEYMAQLAAFGIDGNNMDATVFLQDNVRLARGVIDPPPDVLMAYLQELTGSEIDYGFDGEWGGVHIFQLYAYE